MPSCEVGLSIIDIHGILFVFSYAPPPTPHFLPHFTLSRSHPLRLANPAIHQPSAIRRLYPLELQVGRSEADFEPIASYCKCARDSRIMTISIQQTWLPSMEVQGGQAILVLMVQPTQDDQMNSVTLHLHQPVCQAKDSWIRHSAADGRFGEDERMREMADQAQHLGSGLVWGRG
ncbi:hypothetical protein BP00DRAFT_272403 [Aspergillus indologenus CBS 114.80]|uniref:Uncharacterized protein n=1 Tax=Aspergillus indologenus CBS 114.80 TaxID=1450541 RepID=A0A2V5HWH6_9EURO|nr:hypothetical protein BP00DRAFT_272403 [Aspergillus indologenus CBS 114.80]